LPIGLLKEINYSITRSGQRGKATALKQAIHCQGLHEQTEEAAFVGEYFMGIVGDHTIKVETF